MPFEDFGLVPSEVYIQSNISLEKHKDFFTGEEEHYGVFKYANPSNNKEYIYSIFHSKSGKSFQFLFDKKIDGHIVIKAFSDDIYSYDVEPFHDQNDKTKPTIVYADGPMEVAGNTVINKPIEIRFRGSKDYKEVEDRKPPKYDSKFFLLFNTTLIIPKMHLKQDFDPNKHRANISDFDNEIEKLECTPKRKKTSQNKGKKTQSQNKTQDENGKLGIAVTESPDDQMMVLGTIEGCHAESLGILVGDIIISIDGKKTKDMGIDEGINRMAGKVGTQVNLKIARAGMPELIDYAVTRAVIGEGKGNRLTSSAISKFDEATKLASITIKESKARNRLRSVQKDV